MDEGNYFLSLANRLAQHSNIGATIGFGFWEDCLFSGKIFSV